jgi:hypothetical protein
MFATLITNCHQHCTRRSPTLNTYQIPDSKRANDQPAKTMDHLASLMAIRRRTTCYKNLRGPGLHFDPRARYESLVNLFAALLGAFAKVRYHGTYAGMEEDFDKSGPDMKKELQHLEEEEHTQASRFMQLKQLKMLEEVRSQRPTLAAKV